MAEKAPELLQDIASSLREQIEAFKQEMEAAGADYRFVNYPGAVHSFTNPKSGSAVCSSSISSW